MANRWKWMVAGTAIAAISAFSSSTVAMTLKYTFGSVSGGAYCDGLTLTQVTKNTYTGKHTGCGGNLPANGGKVKSKNGSYLDIETTYPNDPTIYDFYLYRKQNQWAIYAIVNGVPTEINSGPLIKGKPPQIPNTTRSARDINPKAVFGHKYQAG